MICERRYIGEGGKSSYVVLDRRALAWESATEEGPQEGV